MNREADSQGNCNKLSVKLFGELSITDGTYTLTEKDLRSRQLLKLLSFLLLNHDRKVTNSELIYSLWDEEIERPENALKNLVYRLRKALSKVFPDGAGFIVTRPGQHYLDPDLELDIDIEKFRDIYREYRSMPKSEERTEKLIDAASMYKGTVLKNLYDQQWLEYIQAWYRRKYVDLIDLICRYYTDKEDFYKAEMWSINAVRLETEEEKIHIIYLKVCLAAKKMKTAREALGVIIRHFYDDGIEPLPDDLERIRQEYFPERTMDSDELDNIVSYVRSHIQSGPFVCQRSAFMKLASIAEKRNRELEAESQLLMIELDHEDRQESGDLRIRSRGDRLLEESITENLNGLDALTRLGDSKYLILLSDCGKAKADEAAEAIQDSFRKSLNEPKDYRISCQTKTL
ncbi:MAG: winged helix-turn-helix domain-containing protein [Anaerovoracaceae bacterium]|nr:winged helix-turn-helix domain-containing protein [Anaerovoracaceae bacterium]